MTTSATAGVVFCFYPEMNRIAVNLHCINTL